MDVIKLRETDDTPGIILDAEKEIFEIIGRSLPENVNQFYEPILNWLDEYAKSPNAKTIFIFKLTYFNTASSKLILEIMLKLDKMFQEGKNIEIKWLVPVDDEDNEEAGEEFKDLLELPFEIMELPD
jgi:hypothetical protein